MRNAMGDKVFKFVFVILLVAFCYGVVELMTLRFKIGDVYPEYSSLRTDPVGTKAYLESLNYMGGVTAGRNYKDITHLREAGALTVFFLGMQDRALYYMDEEQVGVLEGIAASGGRVVMTFYPEFERRLFERQEEDKEAGQPEEKEAQEQEVQEGAAPEPVQESADNASGEKSGEGGACELRDEAEEDFFAETAISRGLRFSIDVRGADKEDEYEYEDEDEEVFEVLVGGLAAGREGLPELLMWHSDIYFKDLGENWKTVYEAEGLPVMIERRFGKGSIVLATDSYYVSNEAMLHDRHPDLLAWFVGNNGSVVFDETHLGIGESPGVASLVRKYNLHGLVAGILVLALLFVWRSSSTLVPPLDAGASGQGQSAAQAGKDYSSGVVSLLRRNIPAGRIIFTCYEEWKNSFPKKYKRMPEEMKQVKKVLELEKKRKTRQKNPIKAYRAITEILSERKSI